MHLISICLFLCLTGYSKAQPKTPCLTNSDSYYIGDERNPCIVHKCTGGQTNGPYFCPKGFAAQENIVATKIERICSKYDVKCSSRETDSKVTLSAPGGIHHHRQKRQIAVIRDGYYFWDGIMPQNGTLTDITVISTCRSSCDQQGSACIGYTFVKGQNQCFHLPPEQKCVLSVLNQAGWLHYRKEKYFVSCSTTSTTTTQQPTTVTATSTTTTSTTSQSSSTTTTSPATTTTTTRGPTTTQSTTMASTTNPNGADPLANSPGLPRGYVAMYSESHIRGGLLIAVRVTLYRCLELCTNEPLCLSVDYDNRTSSCWLHGGRTYCSQIYSKPYCTHYKKINCYATDPNSWVEIRPDFHVLGAQLLCSSCDVSTCLRACDRDSNCLGMDYNRNTMSCFRHTKKTVCNTLTANYDTISYRKNACAGLRVQSYGKNTGFNHNQATPGFNLPNKVIGVQGPPGLPGPHGPPGPVGAPGSPGAPGEYVMAVLGNMEVVKLDNADASRTFESSLQRLENRGRQANIFENGLRSALLNDLPSSRRNLPSIPDKMFSHKYNN